MGAIGFDQFFKRVVKATGLKSQLELAKILGVHRSAITQAKKRNVVPEMWILKLGKIFDLEPDWLKTGKGIKSSNFRRKKVKEFKEIFKVKARLCAGSGSFETDEGIEEYLLFPSEWLARKGSADKMVLMEIFGNSMEPEIKDGDTILVDQSQQEILAGAVYAVGIEDTIMVKRIEKRPKSLVLLSENPSYPPIFFKEKEMNSVRIIGRVIWISREFV